MKDYRNSAFQSLDEEKPAASTERGYDDEEDIEEEREMKDI
jgi:hypothetical protein